MIVVDDLLAATALSGRRDDIPVAGPVATTWGFHFRLIRALTDSRSGGRLTRAAGRDLLPIAADPPASRLIVLDPREITSMSARLAVDHRLNLLAAELFAAALTHGATIVLTAANVGKTWTSVMATEAIAHRIV